MAEVTAGKMIDFKDFLQVALEGGEISRVSFDYAVTLVVVLDELTFDIRVESPFAISRTSGESIVVDPEGGTEQLAPVLSLLRSGARSLSAHKDGTLVLHLSDGQVLNADHSEDFEAWEVASSEGLRIVCMPGGDLAVWHPAGE